MPERSERMFWLNTGPVDGSLALQIEQENMKFASAHGVVCVSCVTSPEISSRLWLFRFPIDKSNRTSATNFNKELKLHIDSLGMAVGNLQLRAKRQTNLPQPLVCQRLGPQPWTDLGLHSVNDVYNGMLVSFTYYEGRYYHIPHLQLDELQRMAARLRSEWQAVACDCHNSVKNCCSVGCFKCFQSECPDCNGTGWKGFSSWVHRGYPIDYRSKVPIAIWQ